VVLVYKPLIRTSRFDANKQGSPAAHRLFHLQVLPTLAPQLKDPALVEAVDKVRSKVMKEMSGEKCVFA
jgi:hypothetical protein